MQPKNKLTILITAFVLASVIISGCTKKINEPFKNYGKTVETSQPPVCKSYDLGLQLRYPNDWGTCSAQGNQFSLRTNKEFGNKYLTILLNKTENVFKDKLNSGEIKYVEKGDNKYFKILGYGATIDNIGVVIDNDFFLIGYDITDKEIVKKSIYDNNGGGDSKIEEFVWDIAQTIEKIK